MIVYVQEEYPGNGVKICQTLGIHIRVVLGNDYSVSRKVLSEHFFLRTSLLIFFYYVCVLVVVIGRIRSNKQTFPPVKQIMCF